MIASKAELEYTMVPFTVWAVVWDFGHITFFSRKNEVY